VVERTREVQQRLRRRVGWLVTALLGALVVTALATSYPQWSGDFTTAHADHILDTVWHGWRGAVLNPNYWLFIAGLVILERLWPARPGSSALSLGGAQDLVWILGAPVLSLTVVTLWTSILNTVYVEDLGGVTLGVAAVIGTAATAVFAFVLSDFLMWFTHLVRHKVPTFWYFHAVHHAAPSLNALTDNRVHFVEAVISSTIVFVPSRLLGLSAPAATALAIATVYFTAFTHTAVRTNLGPLRYVLVTPQSHRVHHSFAPEHIDVNFGTIFSVWDRMFGTQRGDHDGYVSTGIADPRFPLEDRGSPLALCRSYVRQTAYPFRQMAADLGRGRESARSASFGPDPCRSSPHGEHDSRAADPSGPAAG
jgi:sterol desaturase/sphingolipid hydroxylase (fatty acid hydroxylase superfamily)